MSSETKFARVGIVDDDKIFRYGFRKLTEIKGLFNEILEFSNGKEAIDYLKDPNNSNHLPDALFVDINMPIMDGWEFNDAFGEIKSQLPKSITLYNISSSIDIEDISRAKKNPLVADYLLKPLDENYLAEIAGNLQGSGDQVNYN
ncbi:response regulator [Mucilaginibacter achroorhodeus]|uniref:Response regulator n=1 Tax=Mucilaginibacter achroorhodeus TaxID=2599294 RepID=A0A563TZ02_9SPHI|nr:response regulator [Mucilaginibacter achroorhodeus]TWR24594.1 response regulator [Mucilaginibacter achroorhodeus]